jgi:hypothetical protein
MEQIESPEMLVFNLNHMPGNYRKEGNFNIMLWDCETKYPGNAKVPKTQNTET